MSKSQEFQELHQLLERWRSHNEVHARPADQILYELLKKLINKEGEANVDSHVENHTDENAASFDPGSDDAGPGGNNPGAPNIP